MGRELVGEQHHALTLGKAHVPRSHGNAVAGGGDQRDVAGLRAHEPCEQGPRLLRRIEEVRDVIVQGRAFCVTPAIPASVTLRISGAM